MILRATSAIRAKRDQYRTHLDSGIVGADAPFVIAISGANIPQADITKGMPWILKPLFAVGDFFITVEIGSNSPPRESGYAVVSERTTARGSPVDSSLFMDDRASEISAILFSPHHIKNRPEFYGKPPGNDFLLIHNPFARNPLPVGFLKCGVEYGPRQGSVVLLRDWRPQASPA
jgi:hypothetical protein